MTFAGIVVLISGFQCFFIIHLANLRSVKIVQRSVKSQGIFELVVSGNRVQWNLNIRKSQETDKICLF